AKVPLQNDKSVEKLKEVLGEIERYINEIDKPGEFNERFKNWFKQMAKAENIEDANEILLGKLTDATKDFQFTMAVDTNNVVTDINHQVKEGFTNMGEDLCEMNNRLANMEEGIAAVQIMITQKGNSVTDKDIDYLKVEPYCIESEKKPERRMDIEKKLYTTKIPVAVKKLPNLPDHDINKQLRNIAKQAKIIRLLSACDHIEKFFGVYEDEVNGIKHLFVVTKWMENGNLREYLIKNKQFDWSNKLRIAQQIAAGLEFCNSVNVYHRDVKSKNILLSEHLNAKLTNFELSRKVGDKSKEMPLESSRWTAPEKLKYPEQEYTDKCEVYSFAVLLWEISTHRIPFDYIDNPLKAGEKIKNNERPEPFSKGTPEQYQDIVKEAWDGNPRKRPKIGDVRKKLEKVNLTGRKKDKPVRRETWLSTETESVTALDDSDDQLLDIKEIISLHEKEQYEKAFGHFLKLADRNDPLASYYAGLYLFKGTYGVEEDEIQALQLLKKSAKGGCVQGQYLYSYACLKGTYYSKDEEHGIDVNEKKYMEYLTKAAALESPDALYAVSQLYLKGESGYPVDNDKYNEYLTKAADKGSNKALKELEEIGF
ncbi:7060_t:CDS:2, partial [Acaulospora colombiana]